MIKLASLWCKMHWGSESLGQLSSMRWRWNPDCLCCLHLNTYFFKHGRHGKHMCFCTESEMIWPRRSATQYISQTLVRTSHMAVPAKGDSMWPEGRGWCMCEFPEVQTMHDRHPLTECKFHGGKDVCLFSSLLLYP